MQISVIIPVYNAECYLAKAVDSVLTQSGVEEVILVEDGSTDNSYSLCLSLAKQRQKVKVFTHPDHQNRGAGASRNLGLRQAHYPLVAFLDADDYYLPKRFQAALRVLRAQPAADGVFEAIGFHYYDPTLKVQFAQDLTTMTTDNFGDKSLFELLSTGRFGYFSLDGLVIRRTVLLKVGYFDESLRQTQDTDFIWRLALKAKLVPGSLDKPVSMRGVHGANRIFDRESRNVYARRLHQKWFQQMLTAHWSRAVNWAFTTKKLESEARRLTGTELRGVLRLTKLVLLPLLCLRYPKLLGKLLSG